MQIRLFLFYLKLEGVQEGVLTNGFSHWEKNAFKPLTVSTVLKPINRLGIYVFTYPPIAKAKG